MVTNFDNASFFQGDDFVRIADGAEPVGNDERGASFEDCLQCLLDQIFGFGVDR